MPHSVPTASVIVWAVAVIVLVGCADSPESRQLQHSQGVDPKAEIADANTSQNYVTCRATLTAYEKDHPWFDDSHFGHDDGVAPLASFVLADPPKYADRAVGILFKYMTEDVTSSPPDKSDIGKKFTFQIPEDALEGEYKTIDNLSVANLRMIGP